MKGLSLIFVVLLAACSTDPWEVVSEPGAAPETPVTVVEAPSPTPVTESSPTNDLTTIVITGSDNFDPNYWQMDQVLADWKIPGVEYRFQEDCWGSDVCVLILDSSSVRTDSPIDDTGVAYTIQESPVYYIIELFRKDIAEEGFSPRSVLCHELGHVLGADHVSYPSCMNDGSGFTNSPAPQDLLKFPDPWEPRKWDHGG